MSYIDDNKMLKKITDQMIKKHNCHTVILYGSRARSESNTTSDYDIIAIRKNGEIEKDCRIFEDAYLDAFIYPENYIENPETSLMRIKDGIILVQKDSVGDKLLNKVIEIFKKGPDKTPLWEKIVRVIMVLKYQSKIRFDEKIILNHPDLKKLVQKNIKNRIMSLKVSPRERGVIENSIS
jgi:predicted nucleotidyltransferase